jgi:large subunit ribosomal protein L25
MKTVEIIGYKRANLGKKESNDLRAEGSVPCVMYGGKEQVHFSAPMILFRDLVYTPDAHMVNLNIEGTIYRCILKDIQFHPVSETILHADFLQVFEDKPVKMDIPVRMEGTSPGVIGGGKLNIKNRKLTVKATPDSLPDYIPVDISKLALGKSIKVGELKAEGYEILTSPNVSIATVEIPRALRGKGLATEEEA